MVSRVSLFMVQYQVIIIRFIAMKDLQNPQFTSSVPPTQSCTPSHTKDSLIHLSPDVSILPDIPILPRGQTISPSLQTTSVHNRNGDYSICETQHRSNTCKSSSGKKHFSTIFCMCKNWSMYLAFSRTSIPSLVTKIPHAIVTQVLWCLKSAKIKYTCSITISRVRN